jgi:NADPH:quinone reductase-like Zn-dependent oxidoreductase
LVGDFQSGQSILIHAGASGVGQAAIQVARHLGATKVFATAGTDAKCQLCKSLGADFAINYKSGEDFRDVVMRETGGRGVDLIIDLVGRDYWDRNVASAAMDSKIVLVALMSGGVVDQCNLRALMNKRIWVMPTTLRTRSREYQKKLRDVFVNIALPAITEGKLGITIDRIFSWKQVSEAHKLMESNANAGKILCVVD